MSGSALSAPAQRIFHCVLSPRRPHPCLVVGDWEFRESQEKLTCRDVGHEACSMLFRCCRTLEACRCLLAPELSR